MSIKYRVTMMLGCLAVIYVLVTSALMRRAVLPAFESLEFDFAVQDIELAKQYISGELTRIDDFNMDWSVWSDSYEFVLGNHPEFLEDNFSIDTVPVLHMNFMVYIDRDLNLVWGEAWDLETRVKINIEDVFDLPFSHRPEVFAQLQDSDALLGTIKGANAPLLIASRPVLRSRTSDQVAGTLVMGRMMDDFFFREMEEQISISIDAWSLSEELPDEVRSANQDIQHTASDIFHITNDTHVNSYFNQFDVSGQPVLLAKIDMPRRISGIGNSTMNTAIALFAGLLAFFTLAFWVIFGRLILAPISALKSHINKMRQNEDLSLHIELDRVDEFGDMAREFNALTDQLLESRKESESAKQAAIAASEAKSNFLATMSHEIRTPLNGVLGMAELLLRTQPLSTEQKHYANTITHSGGSLLRILNDILDLSKIESGKLTLETIEFSLREVVEDTLELVAHEAQEKGLELILDVAPALQDRYLGDAGRIRQMLLNLLTNAVKFTETGHVCLRLNVEQSPAENQRMLFEVEDTGIGIEDANKSKLFTPFTQEDTSTTRRFGGTGLGLAVTMQIAELMGGKAGFSSTHGVGSTFWLRVPLTERESPDQSKQNCFSGSNAILYLADELNTRVVHDQLAYWGVNVHQVDKAERLTKAVETLQTSSGTCPLLLLVDKHLLDKNTSRLLSSILRASAGYRTRLVVLCPLESVLSESDMYSLGMPAIVNKPVRQGILRECFEASMQGKGISDATESKPETEYSVDSKAAAHRVLLVEDNTVNLMVAENMLKKLSYSVTTAYNGEEAVELFVDGEFDIVLMDCSMPVMDGYEATRKIREIEANSDSDKATIIALTANAMTNDRERCLQAGMDDFLTKPISMSELSMKLQQGLN